ncbi:hypothetical protein, partial [Pseudomonas viridiflava]|nr:hypothetical protein [Pseudomonas viridiflava]
MSAKAITSDEYSSSEYSIRGQVRSYQTTRNLLTEHVVVGGGLPAMQPTRYVRKIASSFIAG